MDHLCPPVETDEEEEPDWADAVPRELTETAAPQPTDESGGNDSVAASPTVRRSGGIQQAPNRYGH